MPSKLSRRLKKRHDYLGIGTPHSRSRARVVPTRRKIDREKIDNLRTTRPSHK
jgi:hypothetical protein